MPAIDTTTPSSVSAASAQPQLTENAILGKDDFLKLLLVELQNQDPTAPTDADKILSQTSQLATLESADNTNNALKDLSASLLNANQFTTIAAIGKVADIGSDAIAMDAEGSPVDFELYFQDKIESGTISITDNDSNIIKEIGFRKNADNESNLDVLNEAGEVIDTISPTSPNVYQFNFDGKSSNGNVVEEGIYHVNAKAATPQGKSFSTKLGAYPIESVRFDGGSASVKIGSSYIPFTDIKEVH